MLPKDFILTGIKPTGPIHLGNYVGAIRPTIDLCKTSRLAMFMVADLHALISCHNPKELQANIENAENFLNSVTKHLPNAVVFRQSSLPQIPELSHLLSCLTPKGFLNRAHAYKAAVDNNRDKAAHDDAGISAGLFTYPILMSADILIFSPPQGQLKVPVGSDQLQHLEITRDIASRFNANYEDMFALPEPITISEKTLIGIDGRKMSKSYDNTIPFLADPAEIKKAIARIVTDSTPIDQPKDPDTCIPYLILKELVGKDAARPMREKLSKPGFGYGHAKEELFEAIIAEQDSIRSNATSSKIYTENTIYNLASSQLNSIKQMLGLK